LKTFTEEEHIALDQLPPLKEITAGRVYCLALNTICLSYIYIPALPPYSTIMDEELEDIYRCTDAEMMMMKTSIGTPVPSTMIEAADRLHAHLDKAVRRRVLNAPLMKRQPTATSNTNVYSNDDDGKLDSYTRKEASVAILFSGGVDSVVLAALSHYHVPIDEPIDLINVAFAAKKLPNSSKCPFESTPDRQAALLSFQEMKQRWPNREWRLIGVDTNYSEVLQHEGLICGLISPLSSTMDFNIGTAFWFSSRGSGINQHLSHNHCYHQSEHLRFTNVPTETQSTVRNHDNTNISDCNDDNTIEEKKTQTTEGTIKLENTSPQYEKDETIWSSARVLLIGIGADEMMAGYGRFRNVYNKGGYDALREELKKDKDRLWTRNLGRDDRCISYHGKEARFPFLDEDVVSYLNSLDVSEFCNMELPQGEGDKMILRLVARKIGVASCSGLVKRAIQFGSRIAKVSDGDRYGSSRKASGSASHKPSQVFHHSK